MRAHFFAGSSWPLAAERAQSAAFPRTVHKLARPGPVRRPFAEMRQMFAPGAAQRCRKSDRSTSGNSEWAACNSGTATGTVIRRLVRGLANDDGIVFRPLRIGQRRAASTPAGPALTGADCGNAIPRRAAMPGGGRRRARVIRFVARGWRVPGRPSTRSIDDRSRTAPGLRGHRSPRPGGASPSACILTILSDFRSRQSEFGLSIPYLVLHDV